VGGKDQARTSTHPKVESFNFRVEPELKAAFTATTAKKDRLAGQVLRDLIRATRDHLASSGAMPGAVRIVRLMPGPLLGPRLRFATSRRPALAGADG